MTLLEKREPLCLALILVVSLIQNPAFAAQKSYVAYLGAHSHGPEVDVERVRNSHYNLLGSFVGSTENAKNAIFYSYTYHINGFAALITEEQAEALSKHPEVVSVFPNEAKRLHTTRSWEFMGLEDAKGMVPDESLWKKGRYGEDVIIGNLDTGVWPESKSFTDEGYGPVPQKWKGICQNMTCNRKLIGARYFNNRDGQDQLHASADTARDTNGHGTHTLSTVGGNFVAGANVNGYGTGTAKGGSPKARLAMYKVCWATGCYDSDIMAAFDAAITDGVDVISMSVGGEGHSPYFKDSIAIGSFHAFKRGIPVICSAGNSGPKVSTVSNDSPWILTVGASTMDRKVQNVVTLGNKKQMEGKTYASSGLDKFYPLIASKDAATSNVTAADLCKPGSLNTEKVRGKILLCQRGENARAEKGQVAAQAGAVGFILANDAANGNDLVADAYPLPSSHIGYNDGLAVLAYIKSTTSPTALIPKAKTQLDIKPAPVMASFSSVGPSIANPEFLKPDITAPGVDVLASYSQVNESVPFQFDSGTSMSCPHVGGIVGLLKTAHPDWSPSVIKSAIMTTAWPQDNTNQIILDASNGKATPFSYGAGHVRPNLAMDPGLVYNLTVKDYLHYLCTFGFNPAQFTTVSNQTYKCHKFYSRIDFNYPSITVHALNDSIVVTRRITNVGSPGKYQVSVEEPEGISVLIKPKVLKFSKIGQKRKFRVTLKVKAAAAASDYVFGSLTWSDGVHNVRSPIVVKSA